MLACRLLLGLSIHFLRICNGIRWGSPLIILLFFSTELGFEIYKVFQKERANLKSHCFEIWSMFLKHPVGITHNVKTQTSGWGFLHTLHPNLSSAISLVYPEISAIQSKCTRTENQWKLLSLGVKISQDRLVTTGLSLSMIPRISK